MALTTQDKQDIAQIVSTIVLPQFKRIDARFAQQDARFAKQDARFDAIDKRFDQQDARFDQQDVRFDRLEGKVDRLSARLASNHTLNVKHHLETRRQIGVLAQKHDQLREGLALAITGPGH